MALFVSFPQLGILIDFSIYSPVFLLQKLLILHQIDLMNECELNGMYIW